MIRLAEDNLGRRKNAWVFLMLAWVNGIVVGTMSPKMITIPTITLRQTVVTPLSSHE
jgi:hypothetical protein